MNNNKDVELFDGVNLDDLYRRIYENSSEKKTIIDELINSIPSTIKNADDVMMIIPMLKEVIELGVKNDETLIKLAGIVTKSSPISLTKNESNFLMSEEDKLQISNAAKDLFNKKLSEDSFGKEE